MFMCLSFHGSYWRLALASIRTEGISVSPMWNVTRPSLLMDSALPYHPFTVWACMSVQAMSSPLILPGHVPSRGFGPAEVVSAPQQDLKMIEHLQDAKKGFGWITAPTGSMPGASWVVHPAVMQSLYVFYIRAFHCITLHEIINTVHTTLHYNTIQHAYIIILPYVPYAHTHTHVDTRGHTPKGEDDMSWNDVV